ncbi:rRNA processing/ribosome biogenesis-domain-containing protein [Clohesyomyces aquaticus]|uniref:Pre-rRNA-processing protein RIX1 n=1 Tax=Clohesyomyces aquaticus TaxID=1231657 RepID=A0A1Y2A584_9PLEO|nr:rRNA processing/ribosome biogenesis-domain-containing protein [Clohesyomyces aquaticus]
MASTASEMAALRAITFRLSSTSTSQLPQHAPAIATLLSSCRTLLSSPQISGSKSASETSVAVHKYRTLISTLLQDRSIQGRWTAIVLVKATLEIGGWETLQKSLPWVRGLLGILSKPDPPSSKKLCIITLTRIFVLTREYPTLVREITTPSLPSFVQSCLQTISSKPSADILRVVLESFNQLLPRHPTIFRSYLKQLQPLLAELVAPTPSTKLGREQLLVPSSCVSLDVSESAQRLFVQLPCCATKGASSEEWEKALKSSISSVHQAADKVYRAVVEDWKPNAGAAVKINGRTLDDEVLDLDASDMSLPPWSGLYAGGERIIGLLRLIKEFLATPTSNGVCLRAAAIMDLLTRIFSVTIPSSSATKDIQNSVKFNSQVSQVERENLWAILPYIHATAIEVLIAFTDRFEETVSIFDIAILDQLVWLFGSEKQSIQIRTAVYLVVTRILEFSGRALSKATVDQLAKLIRTCCDDLLPQAQAVPISQSKTNGTSQQQSSTNADTFLTTSTDVKNPSALYIGLKQAAHDFLPVLFANIPAQHLSDSLRTKMDRTAILVQHKDAMIASVLNPPPTKKFGKPAASILPLMARSISGEQDVEALLRPRMPIITIGAKRSELDDADEMEDEDEEANRNEDEEANSEAEAIGDIEMEEERFVGEELDTILETAAVSKETSVDQRTADVSIGRDNHDQGPGASNKRPQLEEDSTSYVKRMKTDMDNQEAIAVPPIIPATTAIPSHTENSNQHTVLPAIVATPILASQTTAFPATVAEGSDNEDDDFGELVLGQDTDEESE